jgi:ABC-type glycerol-3-phosphate transport system permease component
VTTAGSSTLTQKPGLVLAGAARRRPAETAVRLALNVGAGLGLAVIFAFFALPFIWMVSSSFKPFDEIMQNVFPLTWKTFVPVQPTFQNFVEIFTQQDFGQYFFNSLLVAFAQIVGTLFISAPAAFALSRMSFRGRDVLFGIIVATMLIPFDVVVVPLFITVRDLHLQDTYWALFLPFVFNPFAIFLLRQAFTEVPRELDEAATIDGANLGQIFWNVVLANSKPALITLAMVTFLYSWNAFFWPLVVMQSDSRQVVSVFIGKQITLQMSYWGRMFAACTVASIPVIGVFMWLQRYYVRGIATTGLKG